LEIFGERRQIKRKPPCSDVYDMGGTLAKDLL